ncbi:hypothetical protein HPB49_010822 [Dermacentor silvarum]|uniref:Uncharacterized protein n=1 Tax=Dermacentor silvarum TaxID=543639 RepID=A0ACB8CKQ4_DERSI|nr:hypothetical protein HPB49_010822 [Dermacentor silvarum]
MAEDHRSTQSLKILLGVSTILTALLASGLDGIKLPCPVGRECPQELLPLPHCNASQLADGRVEALCKILIKAPPLLFFIPSDPEVMTLDELLISDVPLAHNEVAVMSLTRVHVKKWDDFPLSSTNRYDCFISNSSSLLEHVALYSFMVFVRQLELSVTFPKPVKIAIANCSKAQESSKVHCDVYGFKRRFINNDSLPAPMKKFPSIALTLVLIYQWNVEHAVTSKINVTFSGRVKSIPSVALQIIAPFRFTRLVLYSWTRNVLLAKLESPPMRYRVCVAERDFIPGIPITENICRCISQSRVSLFVINAEFCRSRWCMFEMMLAQHRLFESERDEHIVFIKKGPIDESEITPMLSYLITSRTYIDVPQSGSDERLQDIFWLQLQVALQQ